MAVALNLSVDIKLSPNDATVSIVTLDGEVDVLTSPRLKAALAKLVDSGAGTIIVNLHQVNYMDSTGLGVLVTTMKRIRERDGDIVLAGLNPHLSKIFEITGLRKAFKVFPTEDDALQGPWG